MKQQPQIHQFWKSTKGNNLIGKNERGKKKLLFDIILGDKVRKTFAVALGVILIVPLWYIEKTKLITRYSVVFYKMGLRCEDDCGRDKRLQHFKNAVRHDPNFSDAHYQLALIYEKMGNSAESLESYRRVTELDHKNALAYYRVGMQYFEDGEYEYARRHLLQTYRRRECPEDATYYLALIHDRTEEYDSAIDFYKSMVAINDEYAAKIYPRLAEIYHLIGREDSLLYEIGRLQHFGKNDLADQLEQNYQAVQASKAAKVLSE